MTAVRYLLASGIALTFLCMTMPAAAQSIFPSPTHLTRLIPHGPASIPDSNQAWGVAIFALDRESGAARFRISISRSRSAIVRYDLVRIGRNGSEQTFLSLPPLTGSLTADGTLSNIPAVVFNALDSGLLSLRISTADYPDGFVSGKIEPASNMATPFNTAQVVPRPDSSIAVGFFSGTLDDAERRLRYMLRWEVTSSPATEIRFYRGAAGENGTLLRVVTAIAGDSLLIDTWNGISPEDVEAMKQGKIYAVVATTKYGAGEIRGQLTPVDLFGVVIEPEQVVPSVSGSNAQGTGYLFINGTAATGYRMSSIAAIGEIDDSVTSAHIHRGAYGTNGPELAAMDRNRYDAWVFGRNPELYPFDSATLSDMRAGNGYLDFHSLARPDGELRGQLLPAANRLSRQTSSIADRSRSAHGMRLRFDSRANAIGIISSEEQRGGKIAIELYSPLGAEVARYSIESSDRKIAVGALPAGLYIARIFVDGKPVAAEPLIVVR